MLSETKCWSLVEEFPISAKGAVGTDSLLMQNLWDSKACLRWIHLSHNLPISLISSYPISLISKLSGQSWKSWTAFQELAADLVTSFPRGQKGGRVTILVHLLSCSALGFALLCETFYQTTRSIERCRILNDRWRSLSYTRTPQAIIKWTKWAYFMYLCALIALEIEDYISAETFAPILAHHPYLHTTKAFWVKNGKEIVAKKMGWRI